MQKLIEGIHKFHNEVFSSQVELFKKLEKGQKPQLLFITCSDSRINPNLITQTDPGDLFIIRNAGNIIPAYGPYVNGESATIEFAIEGQLKDHSWLPNKISEASFPGFLLYSIFTYGPYLPNPFVSKGLKEAL